MKDDTSATELPAIDRVFTSGGGDYPTQRIRFEDETEIVVERSHRGIGIGVERWDGEIVESMEIELAEPPSIKSEADSIADEYRELRDDAELRQWWPALADELLGSADDAPVDDQCDPEGER